MTLAEGAEYLGMDAYNLAKPAGCTLGTVSGRSSRAATSFRLLELRSRISFEAAFL